MKKSIYPPCIILLVLLLVPVTACTTKTAAEKPQDTPSRQEQPAADVAPRTDDVPAQSAATETAAKTDSGSSQKKPQETTEKPDAVSGATIDSVSGATVSQRAKAQSEPAVTAVQPSKQVGSGAVVRNDKGNSGKTAAQEPTAVPPPALAAADEQTVSGTISASAPTHTDTAAGNQSVHSGTADAPVPAASAEMTSPATAAEQAPIAANTEAAFSAAAEPAQHTAAADTPDTPPPSTEQNVPAYEMSLADLISDFEKQGGSHGYEPPPTFHEEMLDLFSPQIFTVALSKEPETVQKPKVSRMVAVEEKQRLELTYPGHGWVYVGEQTSQPGLKYEQRKLQDNNSIFMFTAEKKGDYVLHFSYFDVFTNEFITDAVAVSVSAARSPAAKAMVKAPEYQGEVDAAETQAKKNTKETASQPSSNSAANTGTGTATHTAQAASEAPQTAGSGLQSKNSEQAIAAGTTEAASPVMGNTGSITAQNSAAADAEAPLSSDQLLEKARTAIAAADAGTALTYLDNFFTTAEEKLDEGWFLKGRAYELNGSVRNIRLALDAYKTLTDGFPQSKYWAEADARIRYITGFYINIQ